MLRTIALVLALAASGLAISAVSANAGSGNFISHGNSQSQADTACSASNVASYCN